MDEQVTIYAGWDYLHLADPQWLWLLPCALLPWLVNAWPRSIRPDAQQGQDTAHSRLHAYAEAHLLPYLQRNPDTEVASQRGSRGGHWLPPAMAMLVIILLVLALAQPRWRMTEQQVHRPDAAVVVVIDVSRSMLAEDVKPSRLSRARQEVTDLIRQAEGKGVAVGLIAFAETAHILSPVTHNMQALRRILPAVDVQLLRLQGSNPKPALEKAAEQLLRYQMLQGGENYHLLLVTDGDLEAERLEEISGMLKSLVQGTEQGLRVLSSVLTVGTRQGAPVKGMDGQFLREPDGSVHISRLQEDAMRQLATAGGGQWVEADFRQEDTHRLLRYMGAREGQTATETQQVWDEGFWLPLILAMGLLLTPWLRRLLMQES